MKKLFWCALVAILLEVAVFYMTRGNSRSIESLMKTMDATTLLTGGVFLVAGIAAIRSNASAIAAVAAVAASALVFSTAFYACFLVAGVGNYLGATLSGGWTVFAAVSAFFISRDFAKKEGIPLWPVMVVLVGELAAIFGCIILYYVSLPLAVPTVAVSISGMMAAVFVGTKERKPLSREMNRAIGIALLAIAAVLAVYALWPEKRAHDLYLKNSGFWTKVVVVRYEHPSGGWRRVGPIVLEEDEGAYILDPELKERVRSYNNTFFVYAEWAPLGSFNWILMERAIAKEGYKKVTLSVDSDGDYVLDVESLGEDVPILFVLLLVLAVGAGIGMWWLKYRHTIYTPDLRR